MKSQLVILFRKGSVVCYIESDKTLTEICTPVSGSVISLNQEVICNPEVVNNDCYINGWLLQLISCSDLDLSQLKSPDWYRNMINSFFRKGT